MPRGRGQHRHSHGRAVFPHALRGATQWARRHGRRRPTRGIRRWARAVLRHRRVVDRWGLPGSRSHRSARAAGADRAFVKSGRRKRARDVVALTGARVYTAAPLRRGFRFWRALAPRDACRYATHRARLASGSRIAAARVPARSWRLLSDSRSIIAPGSPEERAGALLAEDGRPEGYNRGDGGGPRGRARVKGRVLGCLGGPLGSHS